MLCTLGLGKEQTGIDEAAITHLAQISYLANAWSQSPTNITKIADDAVTAFSTTGDSDNLHKKLVALSPIAKQLNCPIELLLDFFTRNNSVADAIQSLFGLQRQSENLDSVGLQLQEYLSIVALSKLDVPVNDTFKKWYQATIIKLNTTKSSFASTDNSNQLQQTLFKQWVHEFCVFTGLKELETTNIVCGIFDLRTIDNATDFSNANLFFNPGSSGEQGVDNTQFKFFNDLIPHILFIQKLNLDESSLRFVGSMVGSFDSATHTCTIKPFESNLINDYCNYVYVYAQIKSDANKLLFINSCWKKSDITKFIPLMGWPVNDFNSLIASLNFSDSTSTLSSLTQLSFCFNYSQITKTDVVTLYGLTQYINPPKNSYTPTTIPIISVEDSQYKQYQTYYAQQLEQDRDALVAVVLYQLNQSYTDINCPDHLSDYFLCDVKMAGCMNIAPLREATDAVQTYLMRCKNGLEQVTLTLNEDETKGISKKQREWIPNFRIWQAEQMLKTYPENYLQPDVRSTATKQFKNMLNSLQGTQITNNKAETAMLNYLDEWIDLLNADIVDASAYKTYSDYFKKDVETLFLISKSTVSDQTFYFSYKDTDIDTNLYHWAPWEEIPVKINADTVSSIYAFNRLHFFWTEQTSVTDTDPTIDNGKYTLYSLTIKCIYQNIDGSWSVPQVIKSFPFFVETSSHSAIFKTIFTNTNFSVDPRDSNKLTYSSKAIYLDKSDYSKVFIGENAHSNKEQIGYADLIHNNTALIHFYTGENLYIDDCIYEFTETSDGLGKFIQVNGSFDPLKVVNIEDFKQTNLYWGKVGLIEVNDKVNNCSYIMVVTGPSYKKENLPYYKINLLCEKDSKLALFKTTLNDNYDLAVKAKENVFAFQPVLLNHALAEVNENQSFDFTIDSSHMTNCKPTYTTANVLIDNYVEFITDNYAGTLGISESSTSNINIFSSDLSNGTISKYFAVRNRPGAFYLETNQTGYLFTINSNDLGYLNATDLSNNTISYDGNFTSGNFSVERIFSTHLNQLRTDAQEKGMAIMDRDKYQNADIGNPQTKFSSLNTSYIVIHPFEDSDNQIDFLGAFGIYARELYFHAPMAIASLLQKQLQYDEVRKWYHYVYNSIGVTISDFSKVWQTNLFSCNTVSVGCLSTIPSSLFFNGFNLNLLTNPFSRPYIAFNKTNNLLLFAVSTNDGRVQSFLFKSNVNGLIWNDPRYLGGWCNGIEFGSNNEICYYYEDGNQSYKIISRDDGDTWFGSTAVENTPSSAQQQVIAVPFVSAKLVNSFDPDIIAENNLAIYQHWTIVQYINFILDFADNEFRQETWESLNTALQLYFEAEDLLGQEPEIKDEVSGFEKDSANRTFDNSKFPGFGIPTNTQIQALWDRVKDRLHKLRNGLNINGERQMPSMYSTAIDPARLLLASQNGGINPYDESDLQANRSVYRFREMAPHTESLINVVVEFGAQLHSALVQKDNELLQRLQATHQLNMLNVVSQTYQYQIDEAKNEIAVLQKNLESTSHQKKYYDDLIAEGDFPTEIESTIANDTAASLQLVSAGIKVGASFGHFTPTIFGMADGGFQPGSAIDSIAGVSSELAQSAQTLSQILATHAERVRRAEEWKFQSEQAQYSIDQINLSISSATTRLQIAQENMKLYNLQVNQANEILNYLTNKFTNAELYNWMSGQMSSLYFTAYQLANSSLHTLQQAYQYELDETDNFIPSNAWNSLYKGLLAGETLKLALARMKDAYLAKNKRRQEIEKIISVKKLIPSDWDSQIEKGMLSIPLNAEVLYKKGTTVKIKSIAVSIPAVIGPYETFNATLQIDEESVTISRGIEDMGVFADEMYDGRYLPFEGIKIDDSASSWKLTIPEAASKNISDVILNIKFTTK